MIYSINEIQSKIHFVAQKYRLKAVYIYGSYARGEATESSDVDFLIDRTNSTIHNLLDLTALKIDLESILDKPVDITETYTIQQKSAQETSAFFVQNVLQERIKIYDNAR